MYTLILGFDAFDPVLFEHLSGQSRLPNLTRYAEAGGYARFAVANPPQSEVSWTSIATGLDPGGHGIFDFVHRDPATYTLAVSLLPTRRGLAGTQFVPPSRARTLFDQAARQGFPATSLWWPATFPARPELPVRTLPGLGTPDIQGRLGVGTRFSSGPVATLGETKWGERENKIPVVQLQPQGKGRYVGRLAGPARKARQGIQESYLELLLDVTGDRPARLSIGRQTVELVQGEWSPILELGFKMGPLVSVQALTRVILTGTRPDVTLYVLPLQLHPLHSPWRYGTPGGFVKQTWQACGPFLTLGWPQDTTALEEGCITAEQFLALCDSILAARERALFFHLQHFHEGVLASVFDSLDRVQHMFGRGRPDIVEAWYEKLDGLLGRVEQRLAALGKGRPKVVVVSDHGFAHWDYKVHLNRWLVERGYLCPSARRDSGASGGEARDLKGVDWSRTRAYAIGLNSLYVNLEGREGQGCVPPGDYEGFVNRLRDELLGWRGPDGHPVVAQAPGQLEAFAGPLAAFGPDLVVGYSPGYRASSQTGLGGWGADSLEANLDHWRADHCMDPRAVPGVLFCSQGLAELPAPSYRDVPALAVGMAPDTTYSASPPLPDEDGEIVEERLRGLGYL